MEEGKCVTKDWCVLSFRNPEADCYLNFGRGAMFDFKYISIDRVSLERKNMEFIIPRQSFINLFKVI